MMRPGRLNLLIVIVIVWIFTAPVCAQTTKEPSQTRLEAATYFGAMISGKELGTGVNATGGEMLIAKLNHGAALGIRAGLHVELVGLEANLLTTGSRIFVKNQFGIAFPNHAERPLICSGDVLLYPFRRTIRGGYLRPYVTSGFGGLIFSADLDNIRDKEVHGSTIWNAGFGLKVSARDRANLYFDLRFTNHRLLDRRGIDLRSATVGIGARF